MVIRKASGIIILLVSLVVIVPLTTSATFVFLGLKIFGILPSAEGSYSSRMPRNQDESQRHSKKV